MALRDYMQELLRAQTSGEHDHPTNDTVKIIIVDDNSFSAIPNTNDDMENRSTYDLSSPNGRRTQNYSEVTHSDHGYLRVDWVGDREESRDETNRIMLDGFRRRQRFLRETLSPKRRTPRTTTESPLMSSPSPIITQWTPLSMENLSLEEEFQQLRRDSQRSRMRRLKTSLQMQRNSSPPLL